MHTAHIFGKVNRRRNGIMSVVMLKCYPTQYWLLIKHSKWNTFFTKAQKHPAGQGLLIIEDSRSHSRHTTLGRTPLDEWSAHPRDLYLTTHNTHDRAISILCTCPFLVGFQETLKPSVPAFLICFICCEVNFSLLSMNSSANWSVNADRPPYYPFLHFKRDYSNSSNSHHSASALTSDKLNCLRRLLTLQPNQTTFAVTSV